MTSPALDDPSDPNSTLEVRPDPAQGPRTRAERRLMILGALGLLSAMGVLAWTHQWTVDNQFRSFRPSGVKINVNEADLETLSLLDQIGPERARRIVEWRQEHGPFRSYVDLMEVMGIGQQTMEGLVGQVWFGP